MTWWGERSQERRHRNYLGFPMTQQKRSATCSYAGCSRAPEVRSSDERFVENDNVAASPANAEGSKAKTIYMHLGP
jgi:hypothetical protein